MKAIKNLFFVGLFIAIWQNGHGQGFLNLDFESAVIVPAPGDPYGRVAFAPAFSNWVGFCGTNQQTLALYNNQFLDSAGIALLTTNYTFGFPGLAHGKNYALLQGGYLILDSGGTITFTTNIVATMIEQTGQIPASARSLLFTAFGTNGLVVTFAGNPVSLTALTGVSVGSVYGADISQFAGQSGLLRFTSSGNTYLDNIQFSSETIPEPSILGVLFIGSVALGLRRWRNSA